VPKLLGDIARALSGFDAAVYAWRAFNEIATARGLTYEQLEDRLVGSFGFDQAGEKLIDYGQRKFVAFLTPALTVELRDEAGKQIKTLPKPSAKDDEAKAIAAKAELAALKKTLKTVLSIQTARMEEFYLSARKWQIEDWKLLFVQNPIMHGFAMGLIWGFYKDDTLIASFRYMSDGSLSDQHDESLDFANFSEYNIGLVHNMELTVEAIEAWKAQLSDYEIEQPFAQLSCTAFVATDEEAESKAILRFNGITVPRAVLMNRLSKLDWSEHDMVPVGDYYGYTSWNKHYYDGSGVYATLYHSPIMLDEEDSVHEVTLTELVFANPNRGGNYKLGDVPARILSDAVYNVAELCGK
jgi:hypothetical protein